ncbi:MAG: TlpA family protein disulfide reductase [Firmicutes bacterium]|nr:TlpA family protein disulfide reductase [Bacillota bacterium]
MRKILPLLVTIIIVAAAIFFLQKQFSQKAKNAEQDPVADVPVGIAVDMRAPDFTLKDLDGNKISLSEQRGQVVMLNFWAISCPYCRAEMPDMQDVYTELHSEGFTILAVNINDSPAEAADFMRRHGYTFPVLIDEDWQVSILYEAYSIPKTLLLDRNGVIRHLHYGPIDAETLGAMVKDLL